MKKLILMMVMVMVVLMGCGNKPEPVTMDEVVGYWYDEAENAIYQFADSGFLIAYAAITSDGKAVGWFPIPAGTFSCGDEVKILYAVGGDTAEYVCEFSEDRNSFTFEADKNTVNAVRITAEEVKAMGVDIE